MNKILTIMLCMLIILPMVSAASSFTFKQNQKTDLKVSCFDINNSLCSSLTTCQLSVNNPDMTNLITNQSMSRLSTTYFNYTFPANNLSQLGTYNAIMVCTDATTGFTAFSFDVNGSGQVVTQSQIIFLTVGIFVLLIFVAFFYLLSHQFTHPGTKVFFMAMAVGTLIFLMGLIASSATTYLAEFPNIVGLYNSYYILMIILLGIAGMGLVVWLIYFTYTSFAKLRNINPED